MRLLVRAAAIAAVALWMISLRRRLHAAQMRGDMYRTIAARLDQRVGELSGQEQ
jgi:hypothetical protein